MTLDNFLVIETCLVLFRYPFLSPMITNILRHYILALLNSILEILLCFFSHVLIDSLFVCHFWFCGLKSRLINPSLSIHLRFLTLCVNHSSLSPFLLLFFFLREREWWWWWCVIGVIVIDYYDSHGYWLSEILLNWVSVMSCPFCNMIFLKPLTSSW